MRAKPIEQRPQRAGRAGEVFDRGDQRRSHDAASPGIGMNPVPNQSLGFDCLSVFHRLKYGERESKGNCVVQPSFPMTTREGLSNAPYVRIWACGLAGN